MAAKSIEEALQFLNVLKCISGVEKRYIDTLYSHYKDNSILMENECLQIVTPIFKKNSLDAIKKKITIDLPIDQNTDLPF